MEDVSKLSKQSCRKKGHFWNGNLCKSLKIDHVMDSSLDAFCEAAKGDLIKEGSNISLHKDNLTKEIANICGFEGLHVFNDRDTTSWAPNIPNMLDTTENNYLTGLTKTALGCAKNDSEKVLGTYEEIKEEVLDNLDDEEKKELKKGNLDLEELMQQRINSDMEFICQDTWGDLEANSKVCLTGDWSGDTHDNYDIGETQEIFTDSRTAFSELDDEALEEAEFEEEKTIERIQSFDIMEHHPFEPEEYPKKGRFERAENTIDEINRIEWDNSSHIVMDKETLSLNPKLKTKTFNFSPNNKIISERDVYPSIKIKNKVLKRETPVGLAFGNIFLSNNNRDWGSFKIGGQFLPINADNGLEIYPKRDIAVFSQGNKKSLFERSRIKISTHSDSSIQLELKRMKIK